MKFIALLLGGLATMVGSLVGRVLLALGMGYTTYKGVDVTATFLLDYIKTGMATMPVEVLQFLAWTWIDKAIGMIFSAWVASMALSGLSKGLTKLAVKG